MEDYQIVELYWQRTADAIQETDRKYGAYCFAIANNILHNAEDSEECVNDTWLAAWKTIPPKVPAILSTFLGKLTRNISLNRWKSRRAYKRGGGEVVLALEELGQCISTGETPEEEDKLPQRTCPSCGLQHDFDYPKCPHCKYDYNARR